VIKLASAYGTCLVLFLAIDMVWLRLIAKDFYAREMGALIRPDIDLRAALAFYLLYGAGLTYFAVLPALDGRAILYAAALGAGVGLMAYGTYDLTNLAVIKGFGVKIAVVDMAWGAALSGLTASLVVAILGRSA
jgi:uncharacterized membrane protein